MNYEIINRIEQGMGLGNMARGKGGMGLGDMTGYGTRG